MELCITELYGDITGSLITLKRKVHSDSCLMPYVLTDFLCRAFLLL